MLHLKQVVRLLSFIVFFLALFLLIPVSVAIIHGEIQALYSFGATMGIMMLMSIWGIFRFKEEENSGLSARDGFLFTTLTWAVVSVYYSLPFILTGTINNFTQAYFEVMSGITTTGASMIDNVEICPRSILMFRSMINWLGGMGIVVLFVAVLPAIGATGSSYNLINAETVGPVKGKLTSKTKNTALYLWTIYNGMTLLLAILLFLGGQSIFDSITIAFSTLSTAGFSTRNASIGAFNSAYVDVVVTTFMVLAAINFTNYHRLINKDFKAIKHDFEWKVLLAIFFGASILGAICLDVKHVYNGFFQCYRYMSFHIASVLSTTGFSTANFTAWPSFSVLLVVLMMFIGGCSGSTGGGIKVARLIVLFKSAVISLKKKVHPNAVYPVTIGKDVVDSRTVSEIVNFFFLYITTWIISVVIISLTGAPLIDCLSSTILTLGNIGLGFGTKLFSSYPLWADWVFSFLMLVGRLEIFTVYILFTRTFWRR